MGYNFDSDIDPNLGAAFRQEASMRGQAADVSARAGQSLIDGAMRNIQANYVAKRTEEAQIRTEGRKDVRAKGVLEESREYGLAEEERKRGLIQDETTPEGQKFAAELGRTKAQTEQAKAAGRKSDRWESSAEVKKKKYLSESDAIDYKQEAKVQYETDRANLIEGKGMIWDDDTGKYSATGEELSIDEAITKLDKDYKEFINMVDSKTQSGRASPRAKATGMTDASRKRLEELRSKYNK